MLKHVILMFLLFPLVFWGQQEYVFTTANGLPSNTVYDIVQDTKGFIWIATSKGVVKYNGKDFKTYTVQEGLPNNDTWKLEATPDGKVWYASKSNRQGYIANDSVYSFPVKNNKTTSPGYFKILGNDFFFSDGGIYSLKNEEWTFSKVNIDTLSATNLTVVDDSTFVKHNKTSVHITIKNKYGMLSDKFIIPVFSQPIKASQFSNFHISVYNDFLLRVHHNGALFINYKTGDSREVTLPNSINIDQQYVWVNPKGFQWKAGGNLYLYDFQFQLNRTIAFPELADFNRAIIDKDGNLWMASLSRGLKMIPATTLDTQHFFEKQKVQKLEILDDTLFVGIFNSPLHYLDEKKMKKTHLEVQGNIYGIKKIKPYGKYLIAIAKSVSDKRGIQRKDVFYDGRVLYDFESKLLGFRDIIMFNNLTYILTHNCIIANSRNHPEVFNLKSYTSGDIKFSKYRDTLLILGSSGLHYIRNDSINLYPNQDMNRPIPYLSSFEEKNRLFLGTDGFGLQVLQNSLYTEIADTKGLSINKIIKKDSLLWLATQQGVQVLKLHPQIEKSAIVNSFYQADGLLDKNVNDIALQDSLLFAATDLGLSKINLKNTHFSQKPSLYFETESDTLSLPYPEANNISISFGTINYTNQKNYTYQYRLLPKQEKWQTTHNQTITFNELDPDQYILEVSVMDQHRNRTVKALHIQVTPLWWQTIFFKIAVLVTLFLVVIFLGFIFYRIIKKRERVKSEREKRLAGLELQALRSQMNPHFVHNSLNAIQYFVQRNEVNLSEKYLSRFSRLIRQFFEYSRKNEITLAEEIELLKNYLEIEKMRFEEKLSYSIDVDEALAIEEINIPSMILQPIVENGINHGIFHKDDNGHLQISFKKIANGGLQICIEDDGIGILEAKEIYTQSKKNYRSNSSQVLKERLELLKQSKNWDIHFEIKDLSEISNASGTRVTLTLLTTHEN